METVNLKKNDLNLVGTTGEYLVCAELGKREILAVLTPKNNPLFDIIAISRDAKKSVAIQVKTMSSKNKQGWKFGTNIDNLTENPNLFVVLVNMTPEKDEFYIYEYDEFAKRVRVVYTQYMSKPKKNGEVRKEVGFRWFDLSDFTDNDKNALNKWELLGL
jgi:hypothetical protein